MKNDGSPDLSRKKVEYIKFIHEKGRAVRTSTIATAFGVDPSTITKTLAELATTGHLAHTPYRGVSLTREGKRYAEFLLKRHRLLSLILVRNGLSGEHACEEASRFESLVSREAVDIMCRSLGHPRQGACGEITHDEGCFAGDSAE